MLVVELLEMVEIDHHHADFAVLALGQPHEALQAVFHVAPVVEPGQRIAQRLVPQLFAQRPYWRAPGSCRRQWRRRGPSRPRAAPPHPSPSAKSWNSPMISPRAIIGISSTVLVAMMVLAAELAAVGAVEVRLAALQRPALVGRDGLVLRRARLAAPARRQHQPVARIVEHIERARQSPAARSAAVAFST